VFIGGKKTIFTSIFIFSGTICFVWFNVNKNNYLEKYEENKKDRISIILKPKSHIILHEILYCPTKIIFF